MTSEETLEKIEMAKKTLLAEYADAGNTVKPALTWDKVDKAGEALKKEHGLCSDVDKAIQQAKDLDNPDIMLSLELIAYRWDKMSVFRTFQAILARDDMKLPDIGRWIRAHYKDRSVQEFEVTEHRPNGAGNIFLSDNYNRGFISTEGKGLYPGRIIKAWEYIDKPVSEYKVGDVVPAGVTLDREWLGERPDVGERRAILGPRRDLSVSRYDRLILWIEDPQ